MLHALLGIQGAVVLGREGGCPALRITDRYIFIPRGLKCGDLSRGGSCEGTARAVVYRLCPSVIRRWRSVQRREYSVAAIAAYRSTSPLIWP